VTVILAIDPGSERSGWVVLNTATAGVRSHGKVSNPELLGMVRDLSQDVGAVVIEWMSSYGRTVGAETFEALYWAGRFAEAADLQVPVVRVKRAEVVSHLLGGPRRKGDPTADAMLWQVLVDRYGGVSGKAAAVGVKASPGPLYGIHSDARAALALAVTYCDQLVERGARL
jgi:hypothetical protein